MAAYLLFSSWYYWTSFVASTALGDYSRLAAMATCLPSTTLLHGALSSSSSSAAAGPGASGRTHAIFLLPRASPVSKKRLYGAATRSHWGKPELLHLNSLFVRATTTEQTSTEVSKQFDGVAARTETSEETSEDVSKQFDKVFSDLKEKWDSIENKSAVITYGSGALLALWISSTVIDSINSIPLIPKAMELIGLGYSVWFTYRYLLFKKNREELAAAIEDLKRKITG